jgi:uncharacterized Ntn-hydrolase superfamily protein
MTFSLVARCHVTGRFGMVISSSSPAVAARCAHVRARVGAVASQNITDPMLGILTLDGMQDGMTARQAVKMIMRKHKFADYRQLMAVDRNGLAHIHSGKNILGVWAEATAPNCAAAGNLLANESVPQQMVNAFSQNQGDFGDRLMFALEAGLAAGGEAGPVHSAGLKIADKLNWPYADLRVDWSDAPIADLRKAWDIYKPQADAYIQRAVNPEEAPHYGVPGER